MARYFRIFIFSLLCLAMNKLLAFEVPALTGPVIDQANYLSAGDLQSLNAHLRQVNQMGHAQVQVLILQSLDSLNIEQASIKIVEEWKLGDAQKDNGILLLLSAKDRKLRIEVGQGLEGDIPDVIAKRIISDLMLPYLRKGRTSEAIMIGVQAILKIVAPEYDMQQDLRPLKRSNKNSLNFWVFLISVIVIIFGQFAQRRSYSSYRSGPLGRRNYYGGGGGFYGGNSSGGSFGGGGFGSYSGGGGGFSGGGASDSW